MPVIQEFSKLDLIASIQDKLCIYFNNSSDPKVRNYIPFLTLYPFYQSNGIEEEIEYKRLSKYLKFSEFEILNTHYSTDNIDLTSIVLLKIFDEIRSTYNKELVKHINESTVNDFVVFESIIESCIKISDRSCMQRGVITDPRDNSKFGFAIIYDDCDRAFDLEVSKKYSIKIK